MSSAQAILEIEIDDTQKEEVQLPEKLIKDYHDLNEKIDQVIVKIYKRKHPANGKTNIIK